MSDELTDEMRDEAAPRAPARSSGRPVGCAISVLLVAMAAFFVFREDIRFVMLRWQWSRSPDRRLGLLYLLDDFGDRALPFYEAALREGSAEQAGVASWQLGKRIEAGLGISELLDLSLRHEDAEVREAALGALAEFEGPLPGRWQSEVARVLAEAPLGEAASLLRLKAISLLCRGPLVPEARQAFLAGLPCWALDVLTSEEVFARFKADPEARPALLSALLPGLSPRLQHAGWRARVGGELIADASPVVWERLRELGELAPGDARAQRLSEVAGAAQQRSRFRPDLPAGQALISELRAGFESGGAEALEALQLTAALPPYNGHEAFSEVNLETDHPGWPLLERAAASEDAALRWEAAHIAAESLLNSAIEDTAELRAKWRALLGALAEDEDAALAGFVRAALEDARER